MNMTIPVLMSMAVLAADMNESVTIALMKSIMLNANCLDQKEVLNFKSS